MMLVMLLLSVYPQRASLKNMPGHGGNRTYDLWNTSSMLCQLSYAVRSAAQLAEHWVRPDRIGRRFDSHRGQAYFSSLPGVDIHSE